MRSIILLSLSSLAFAQNAFNVPTGGYGTIQAGSTVNLSWAPTTGGTVTLVLRSGSGQNLAPGSVIQANVQNSGSYSWKVPSNIAAGTSYAIQIVDDQNPNIVNYTPPFPIDSSVSSADASSVTGLVTFASTASSAASSGASSAASTDASSAVTSAPSSSPTSGASSAASTGSTSSHASSATPTSAQSTINNHTGAAFRALPTAFVGAVGAVMGAAAFVI